MKPLSLNQIPATVALILCTVVALSAQEPPKAKSPTHPSAKVKTSVAGSKAKSKVKRVDINSATKDQLKTIPGITDAFADKIIAGRPYVTKTRLVTRKVLPDDVYASIKHLIEAQQPRIQGR